MAAHNSAEAVDSVVEILIQIFQRLPIKSLMRFKLVSKRWNSVIISRHFFLLHNPGCNPAMGLFYPDPRSYNFDYIHLNGTNQNNLPFRELGFPWRDASFWIHQSCNGLFLCCSAGYFDALDRRSPIRSIYVYNPTTNCFTQLPRPGIVKEVPRIVVGVNLAFDYAKFPVYKVVCVRGSEYSHDLYQIEIYSSESGEWTLSGEPFKTTASFNYGVYWNGSIHWINYETKELLHFNVDEERFGKMPLPGVCGRGMTNIPYLHHHEIKTFGYFGESCDHLHIIQTHNTEIAFDVYEMKRDSSEWFVKYHFDLHAVAAAFPEMVSIDSLINITYFNFSVFSLVRAEEESSFLVLKISGKGIKFDLDCNTFEEIYDFGEAAFESSARRGSGYSYRRTSEFMLPCAFQYFESLAHV